MLTEPQQKHLKDAVKELTDTLDSKQHSRLCFLMDSIIQYSCHDTAWFVHEEVSKMPREKREAAGLMRRR